MQTQSGGGACYTVHCVSEFIIAVKADIDCPVLPSHLEIFVTSENNLLR